MVAPACLPTLGSAVMPARMMRCSLCPPCRTLACPQLHLLLFHVAWRVPCGLSAAVQLVMLACVAPTARGICSVPLLQHPLVQKRTRRVFLMLTAVGQSVPLAPSHFTLTPPTAECAAVCTWMQVALGFLLPVAWETRTTARLFHHHQRQRQQAGLPPEGGLQAATLELVYQTLVGAGGVSLFVLVWAALSVSFEVSLFVAALPGSHGPPG